ncbi:MAG: wax ester/triacylglycerol synthase family O-acyltransferase [Acidimicrobiia bacterium]
MAGHYERLSHLDNSFLALESRTTHMHVAGLSIFEAEPLRDPHGGIDVDRISRFVASKLHQIPRYRQRLARVPIERHPVWVDDEHFHIGYHVRHASLPRPGTDTQLHELMGRLVSQQLDRSKPLWEMYLVEGLEDDRFAMISKVHHCMIDGVASVDLMAVLLNLAPMAEIESPPEYVPRPAPGGAELVVRETARRAARAASTLRSARKLTEDVQAAAFEGARRVRAVTHSLGSGWLSQAPRTPINGTLGPNRRFATFETPLAEVKEVKNALGGTVNDVVLATVAGGMRKFLTARRDFDVSGLDFRVMAPVSVRSKNERGTMGNQVAMWLMTLPVSEEDPALRLEAVRAATENLKRTDQAQGAATLVRMSAGAPATLVSLASRLAQGARPFNLTVTNVPGPQFPLYMLESRLVAQYGLVPLWHSHGMGVALFSYDGALMWGLNADYDLGADVEDLGEDLRAAFTELLSLARAPADENAAAAGTGKKTPRTPKKRPVRPRAAARSGAKQPAGSEPEAAKE